MHDPSGQESNTKRVKIVIFASVADADRDVIFVCGDRRETKDLQKIHFFLCDQLHCWLVFVAEEKISYFDLAWEPQQFRKKILWKNQSFQERRHYIEIGKVV